MVTSMEPALFFLGACAGLVVIGWVVSKITGSRASFLEDWTYDDGEQIVWRDEAADVYPIAKNHATFLSFPRVRRHAVIVTNRRILVGLKTLSGKHMVQYVLSTRPPADAQSEHLAGGLMTVGHQSIVIAPTVDAHLDEKKPYLDLTPSGDHASSVNLQTIRILTDQGATFRLP